MTTPSLHWTSRARQLAGDLLLDRGGQPLRASRLRTAGWVRLLVALPLVWLPTGGAMWLYGRQGHDRAAARHLFEVWLVALVVAVGASLVAIGLRDDATEATPRRCWLAAYLPAAAELASGQLFGYGLGALANHTVLWIIVLLAIYRVFLGYPVGRFVGLAGVGLYLFDVTAELLGWLPRAPLLPAPPNHLGYVEPSATANLVGAVVSGIAVTFMGVNYGANAVGKLHRYLTESVLGRFLPPALVQRAARGELRFDAPHERRIVTVISVDLVGFTALSESLAPEELAARLDAYLGRVAAIAHEHGATVDKFVGDAVVIVLGAPESLEPAEQARLAIAIAERVRRPSHGRDEGLTTRIGIATGEAVVGIFGTPERSDYTIVGPAVSLAAGLEGAAGAGGTLLSEETARHLGDEARLERVGPLVLGEPTRAVFGYRLTEAA